jgi:D-glycero-alpha-D-manno-heptose-7-phosphate kinase
VLITRTPLRVPLGGGGTDLPCYYRRSGALVVAAAITRHVYISVNRTFADDYFLKYSEVERVRDVADIRHPIIREALRLRGVGPSVEVVSMADVPAGTGLGSSGTFTVGLLHALRAFAGETVTPAVLAEEACHVEIDRLHRPVGKQDQYVAAFGGLACLEFRPDGRVSVLPLRVPGAALRDLEERLLLFFTGRSRSAAAVLGRQRARLEAGDEAARADLDEVARIGRRVRDALERGDAAGFAALMNEHWELKRRREPGTSSSPIDRWCEVGRANGALGGKLVGAGGGGFLLFYAGDTERLRRAMAREGLAELRFGFDRDGSTVVVRD